ncbi:tRNA (adenosine(37)-N6)-threonylcarbamoyltransferase complex dimerization subunit type 1 TsaB [Deinococcus aetherius]|uniref:tRNA (Adenosine(37)-N6)-threonylcarbamoyltransferase complex dimerization subunit type 1 TsaB n=1 Tax=Deinococcus aetherius TaxID=200252 RepID=A0ABN6RFE9_9DEIO|nr:tRNA (adenosine(37)-N6)-threonylcarbamoyltransferase complex dimerization subunit type 1 TsaB [Deinococcus aetherius]BDP42080.1 tRNA (adenosine(37)-N6)-threonylcarbamoyltransferase complex dimerization subunit type 1 TsaB [Deinococcus aetherius]
MPGAPSVTLALDTATPFLTLAVRWPGGERHFSEEVGRAHAERLADATRSLFGEAGLPFRAERIVIGTGPGSYTGVRVGASYALGLGRVWNVPVLGVSTLEGLVRGPGGEVPGGRVAVAQGARRGQVYGAVYEVREGAVAEVVHAPAKRPLEEFEALAAGLPLRRDTAPGGLALLEAGARHGQAEWSLAYL